MRTRLSSTTGPGVSLFPLYRRRCDISSPASASVAYASLMSLKLPCILTVLIRTCPVVPLVMGHPTAVSGAMPLLHLHLACLFEWSLGSGAWIVLVITNAEIKCARSVGQFCKVRFVRDKWIDIDNNERRHQNSIFPLKGHCFCYCYSLVI